MPDRLFPWFSSFSGRAEIPKGRYAEGTVELDRSATIRDVAREAGVSPATVSRTFARPGRVSTATAAKVRMVAERLKYRADMACAPRGGFPAGAQDLLGISVADLGNPIYSDYVNVVQRRCLHWKIGLMIVNAGENGIVERKSLRMATRHAAGIIAVSPRASDASIRKLAEIRPLVSLNRPVRGVVSILPDPSAGLLDAVTRLQQLGHTAVTYLAGPAASWQDGRRYRVLSETCAKLGMRLRRILTASPTLWGGTGITAERFMARPTSAVIAYNDMIALGFVKRLTECGIRVPADVSVIGIDDIPFDTLVAPALSTIKLPRVKIAELAVDELMRQLRGIPEPDRFEPIALRSAFVSRGTIGPCRGATSDGKTGDKLF